MLPTKPRKRTINFRVTEEEYDEFRRTCVACQLRSISDLARTALRQMMRHSRQREQKELANRIRDLESSMSQLKAQLERPNGAGQPGSES
jgi:hypothetical protein